MVELTHTDKRYMVENGNWYRRLEVGEVIPWEADYRDAEFAPSAGYVPTGRAGWQVEEEWKDDYRVPCTDPRPPFTVGQRVKVARKDESWEYWEHCMETYIGYESPVLSIDKDGDVRLNIEHEGPWHFPPWCLDTAEEHEDTLADMEMLDLEKRFPVDDVWESQPQLNGEPCLTWILAKLAKQPEKTVKKLEIIQRAMSELVKLESDR